MPHKRAMLSALAGSWLLYSSLPLYAQEQEAVQEQEADQEQEAAQGQEAAILPKERLNVTVEAVTDVPMRKRPPNLGYLFIFAPGETVGVVKKGEKVKINGKKFVKTFFGDDVWVKVKRVGQEKKPEGWVYFGSGGISPYFQLVAQGD